MTKWIRPSIEDAFTQTMAEVFAAGERNHHISNTAYPIAHNQTWANYKVSKSEHQSTTVQAFEGLSHISLYSHIPFCETRCYFCEYTVVGKSELSKTQDYMNALGKELKMYNSLLGRRTLLGLDIGGGTPSFIDASLIDEHIQQVTKAFDFGEGFAISIETTPKIAATNLDKMKSYFQSGIKRISMGIQVTQPDLLKLLGREANGLDHIQVAVDNIRSAGFNSFNIDLMYGFAGQSSASWEATLNYAINLKPEYITLYRMRYKLTQISYQASQVELQQIAEQSQLAKTLLSEAGYWANPGKNTYSRIPSNTGTSAYLTSRVIQGSPYLGIGLGAQTYTHTSISYNSGAVAKNLDPYFKDITQEQIPIQDCYLLPAIQMMAKMVAVSFYFGEINLQYFHHKFGISLEEAFGPAIKYAQENNLRTYTDSLNGQEFHHLIDPPFSAHQSKSLSLTKKGAQHFNGTIALFFAPSIQKYLINRDPNQADDMHINQKLSEKVFNRNERVKP